MPSPGQAAAPGCQVSASSSAWPTRPPADFPPTAASPSVDLPDDEAAAAVALTANSTGAVHVQTTVLLSAEKVDPAARRAIDNQAPVV
jgi:hypothetical protein